MAMSSAHRTRLHRLRKKAEEYSNQYLDGVNIATAKQFIKSKEWEARIKYQAAVVQFDYALINPFYENLKEYDSEKNKYSVDDLIEAWSIAEKEAKENS